MTPTSNWKIVVCTEKEEFLGEKKFDSLFFDLRATDDHCILSGHRRLVGTGIKVAMPPDCFMEIRPRSGLAFKHGITVLNSPGTIDSDYRGEVGAILINLASEDEADNGIFRINQKDRICQARFVSKTPYSIQYIIDPAVYKNFADHFPTERGAGGFGSTGTK